MTSKTRSLIGALAASAGVAFAAPAHSAFLSNFEGWSVFGQNCSVCDATVSFAVYENTDGNWTNDAPFSGRSLSSLLSSTDAAAKYVYLYQVVNTNAVDPVPPTVPSDGAIQDFNIFTGPAGSSNPFSSGGAILRTVFQSASTSVSPIDTANDGAPSAIGTVTPFADSASALSPDSISFLAVSNSAVNPGNPGQGISVAWNTNNEIPVDGTSSLIYLTSNLKPSFTWAETQSQGGSGAPGDVPAAIPEPGTWALLGLGMAGLLGWGGRRRKNAA